MAKATTPSYILELELKVSPHERKILNKRFEMARSIYNACLGECLKRLHKLQADSAYQSLVKEYQQAKKAEESKNQLKNKRSTRLKKELSVMELSYGYSDYDMQAWVSSCQKHFGGKIGAMEAQKLSTRAFSAVEKLHYHKADKVNFKGKDNTVSIENKSNKQGLRYQNETVIFGELKLKPVIKRNDTYAQLALGDRTKYIRLIKKEIRGRERFFVQLVQEGCPPSKKRETKEGTVGLDIGPSTLAIVSEDHAELVELSPEIKTEAKKLRRIERAMDRSKRSTNPQNYNSDGTTQKGCKWNYSNRYKKLKAKRKELHRKVAAKRKQSHEELANKIKGLGNHVKVETMRFQSMQKRAKATTVNKKNGKINKKKRFGKSIANHAPAMLLEILNRKLQYDGQELVKVDTFALKASQFNHAAGTYQKKLLSERWNIINGSKIQRDLYSAFLISHADETLKHIDIDQCNQSWDGFIKLHDQEVARIRNGDNKTLKWYVA